MAIFGFFGKKDQRPASTEKKFSTKLNVDHGNPEKVKQAQCITTRANATAKKIDAIELEMSLEFHSSIITVDPDTLAQTFEPTKPIPVQDIEEAAILYANEQFAIAEQLLAEAVLDEQLGKATKMAWWMLFDLYQIMGKQEQFESLSIKYASKFETSPPAWVDSAQAESQPAQSQSKGTSPTVAFAGKLDGGIIKLLERVQKFSENSKVLRLEFSRITEVDPIGCGLLLRTLQKLQKSEHDLILVGAAELVAKIRSILQVGRRDQTEAPWLLMLELMRLLNQEKDFEEASINYCITFEVSPPAFVAPQNKITTAAEESGAADALSDSFLMPSTIDGKTDQLIASISKFAADHNPALLDCKRLTRVDFTAAGQLLTSLAPVCRSGHAIEMHNVNYLVYALFNVMGLKEFARIVPRKL